MIEASTPHKLGYFICMDPAPDGDCYYLVKDRKTFTWINGLHYRFFDEDYEGEFDVKLPKDVNADKVIKILLARGIIDKNNKKIRTEDAYQHMMSTHRVEWDEV
jgi:hypothetical protein